MMDSIPDNPTRGFLMDVGEVDCTLDIPVTLQLCSDVRVKESSLIGFSVLYCGRRLGIGRKLGWTNGESECYLGMLLLDGAGSRVN